MVDFCKECGYLLQKDWIVCPKCGTKIVNKISREKFTLILPVDSSKAFINDIDVRDIIEKIDIKVYLEIDIIEQQSLEIVDDYVVHENSEYGNLPVEFKFK